MGIKLSSGFSRAPVNDPAATFTPLSTTTGKAGGGKAKALFGPPSLASNLHKSFINFQGCRQEVNFSAAQDNPKQVRSGLAASAGTENLIFHAGSKINAPTFRCLSWAG
jgi:hypothetical protein